MPNGWDIAKVTINQNDFFVSSLGGAKDRA
jgi:hypothetical protein